MPTDQTFCMNNRVVLVTGASRGIGESIARLLATYGAHIIVSSRKLVSDSITANGGSAEALACHIGDLDAIEAAYDHIDNIHGRIDVLVNNGGGSIINVASVNGVRPAHSQGVYSMSKAAVINMTQSLAACSGLPALETAP